MANACQRTQLQDLGSSVKIPDDEDKTGMIRYDPKAHEWGESHENWMVKYGSYPVHVPIVFYNARLWRSAKLLTSFTTFEWNSKIRRFNVKHISNQPVL